MIDHQQEEAYQKVDKFQEYANLYQTNKLSTMKHFLYLVA